MRINDFDNVLKYLPVLLLCLFIGYLGRGHFVNEGSDGFITNLAFWFYFGLAIIGFAIVNIFLDPIVRWILKYIPSKTKSELPESQISTENLEDISEQQDIISEPELFEDRTPNKNIKQIREQQQTLITNQKQAKIDIATEYTQEAFALYTSEDDLELLCDNVILYVEKLDLKNIKPIKVKDLSNLDLYHFGWNIWNHFRTTKQEEVAQFLKMTFVESLKDVEITSIKTHLKDDEQKGIILISSDLSDL